MSIVLQVKEQAVSDREIVPLLARYQLLPQLLGEIVIDQAIASIEYTPEEVVGACREFYKQKQLVTEAALEDWLQTNSIIREDLPAIATRKLRIEKFQQATWGHKVESYFLTRKQQLDKVVYSIISTQDVGIAQELYFRIQGKEQSFVEAARQYSLGTESQTGGFIGPIEMSALHPQIAQLLATSQPGQLWHPMRLENWFVIGRLEQFIPAQLDEPMRQRLLNEMFATWLQEQVRLNAITVES